MSNTLGPLIGPMYEALDRVSMEQTGFISSVTRDNGAFASAAVGQVVNVFVTPPVTISDIVPGVTAPNDGDQVIGTIPISLGYAKRVPIRWNGEETLAVNNAGPGQPSIFVQQCMQAIRTLRNSIETTVAATALTSASRASGTPGTAPFGTAGDLSDFAVPNRILDDNGAPMVGRRMVVNAGGMQNLRGKESVLFKVNEAGTSELLRQGTIGEVQGFSLGYSPGIATFTKGTAAGYTVGSGTYTAGVVGTFGSTVIPLTGGTGTLSPGDSVSFAGDTRNYVVVAVNGTTTAGQTPSVITIGNPGLRQALAAGTAVTVNGSYTPNIAFTPDALVLATRMPASPPGGDMAIDRTMIADPYTGLAFEMAIYPQYRQVHYEIGIVWGTAAIKQEHICLLFG